MTDALDRLDVSRETHDRLLRLQGLLAKWNPAINLVSKSTVASAWDRHILDSAQLFPLMPAGAGHWVDLGSGGGFPGLVIAVLAAELAVDLRVSLVEADQRKATFLREAARSLGVQPQIYAERIEKAPPMGANVLSARALAALPHLCFFAQRHLSPRGVALFPKGASWRDEVAEAGRDWRFDLTVHPSETESAAVILELKAISHV
ncbi:MAG: hypothetical protein RIT14_961 [Pseudomonadota bacterium]|jgi:16S rRNA (guanine527-N7)-methyltransferase